MKKIWVILFSCVVLILGSSLVVAHGGEEEISNFHTQITVSQDSVATITESIAYDFGSLTRHGIERYIPLRTKTENGKYYYYKFQLLSATQDGNPVQAKQTSQGGFEIIRLGDPNRTISGPHDYVMRYQLSPVILKDPQGDYFNWNLMGNDWQVTIDKASALVEFEPDAKIDQARCYSGPVGSTAQDCNLTLGAKTIVVTSQKRLEPGEGLTLNALLPTGTFSNYQQARLLRAEDILPLIGLIVGIGFVVIGILARLWSWLRYRLRLRRQLVIAQYESPDKLTPGEIGLLNDNRSDIREITATLVDLAVRGYIKIEQTQAKGLFKKPKYTFHKLKGYDELPNFETKLLDLLFDNGAKTAVPLAEISRTEAGKTIEDIKENLKSSLEKKGYYAKALKPTLRRRLAIRLLVMFVLAGLIANLFALATGATLGLVIGSCVALVMGSIFGWLIAKRTELTQTGYKEWAQVEGFKEFMSLTEKDRLKFHDAPAKNPKQFSQLLPFAIALGVEKQWAKQFADMDVAKDTGWYSGQDNFNSYLLANSLSKDFSGAVGANLSTPSSSGGYSGGGFSGGGGGGGGGGSW